MGPDKIILLVACIIGAIVASRILKGDSEVSKAMLGIGVVLGILGIVALIAQ